MILPLPKQPNKIMFLLARIFGRKVGDYAVFWRGAYWVLKDVKIEILTNDIDRQYELQNHSSTTR